MATSTRRTPFAALHRAVHAIQQAVTESGLELTHPEAVVIAHLAEAGPAAMGDLHRAFGFRKSTATSVVDRLVDRGLATRKADPEDARSRRVTLTASGARIGKRVLGIFRDLEPQIARILGDMEP